MGEVVDRRIFEAVASPSTYQNKQTGFDGSNDSDLGFKMFCGKDDAGEITKMLAKDKPARISELSIVNDDFQFLFEDSGNIGVLTATNTVTSLGQLKFLDDLLDTGGIVARFADDAAEAAAFLSDFGDASIMGALSWLKDNPVSGLAEGGVAYGASDGSLGQSEEFMFDETNDILTIGDATVEGSDSVVIGSGAVDTDRSLLAGSSLDVGQGTGHAAPLGESLLCLGTQLTIDAQHGSYIGTYLDVDGCDFSSALGENLTMTHDYADCRGKYATSIFEGGRHFSMDRYDTDDGSAMGVDGLVLVGSQSGGGECVLRPRFGDSETYSFIIPDNRAVSIDWICQTTSVGSDALKNGLFVRKGTSVIWRNAGWEKHLEDSEVVVDRGSHDGDDWETSLQIYHDGSDPDGTFRVEVTVSGTCTTTLNHVFAVKMAVVSQTAYYQSS
jgi:hypothetical protein